MRVLGIVRRLSLGLLVALAGCGVVADLINPDFVTGFGLDAGVVRPSQGIILVAFNNQTRSEAALLAFMSRNANDLTRDSRNILVVVEPRQVRNEVLDCPVGVISPGSLGADFSISSAAALVGGTEVTYDGPPVVSGVAFRCGDVVEIRLEEVTGAGTGGEGEANVDYRVTLRVIPGQ